MCVLETGYIERDIYLFVFRILFSIMLHTKLKCPHTTDLKDDCASSYCPSSLLAILNV